MLIRKKSCFNYFFVLRVIYAAGHAKVVEGGDFKQINIILVRARRVCFCFFRRPGKNPDHKVFCACYIYFILFFQRGQRKEVKINKAIVKKLFSTTVLLSFSPNVDSLLIQSSVFHVIV